MSNFAPKRITTEASDRRWLRDMLKAETHGVTTTLAKVTADANGAVKDGSLIAGEGLVLNPFTIKAGETHLIAVVHAGTVDRRYLPAALTKAQEESLRTITFINGVVPA